MKREVRPKEPQAALAVTQIKQSMAACGWDPRWALRTVFFRDGPTKQTNNANFNQLVTALKSGRDIMINVGENALYRGVQA